MLKGLKDKLYYYFAEKNWGVRREYGPYVDAHQEEHAKTPWKHWWMLIRLNWHYRVLRRESVLYYAAPDQSAVPANEAPPARKTPPAREAPPARPRKQPYMDGPESRLRKRPLPAHLAMQMLPYDVISFDIFDTLILRPFANPTGLFYIIGKRLNMPEFYRLRIETEKKAKETAFVQNGSREVTIYDIYELIERKTGLPRDVGVKTEFEAELQYCKANPYIRQVFRMLQEQQKTIIIVSDMYLPHDMMARLLENCGYCGYEKLYISCDYGCGKNTKGLYKYVLRDFPDKSIIHVGDNYRADVERAKECGISAVHYKNVHELGGPYRADGMSELVGSAYAGLINAHLHNGIKQYDPYYEYGFVYGGLYVFGFCSWIYRKAKREGVEKILFLSRDGAIYQRIFQQFFGEIPSEYFLWSRVANSKYTFIRHRASAFENALTSRIRSTNLHSVGEFLDDFCLGALKKYLTQYGLKEETLVLDESLPRIERLLSERWAEVEKLYSGEQEQVRNYIAGKIGRAKKVAFVDVGWVGNGPMGLKYLVENEIDPTCEVRCWQAAAISSQSVNIAANQLDNTVEPYLFSSMQNRDYFNAFVQSNKGLNHMFFEMLTQDASPSYVGMSDSGGFCFQLPEVENYAHIRAIHQGIEDFGRLYYKTFCPDTYMYNISGVDAFAPFRFVIRDVKFFKQNLSEFVFSRVAGINNNTEIRETVGKRIKNADC